jgi:RHS repeat-associated protein
VSDPDTIIQTDNANGVTPGRIEGGAFGVTPDGAATYTLPLWVPVGRRGIQPELELQYHSRAGNGTLGVGWSLSGISQITRSRKTIADDGVEGQIRFDKTDPFTLDGERLVLVSGTHGVDGAEYRTKRDTFTKIILHDVDSAPDGTILGPTWFEAFHKDGRICVFGGIGTGDLGSRFEGTAQQFVPLIFVPGSGTTDSDVQSSVDVGTSPVRFAWSLCSVRDRSGNMLLVYYDGFPSVQGAPPQSRDYVAMQILYTGSPTDGTPAMRTVDFVWGDRPDPQTTLMSGLRIPHNKRLQELRMSGPDPTSADSLNTGLLRRYVFTYQNNSVSSRSLLTSVQELDRFGVAKGAHSFAWDLGLATFRDIDTKITNIQSTPAGRSLLPGRIRVADFDGDGHDDILYVPNDDLAHFYILRADGTSSTGFAPRYKTNIPVPADRLNGRLYVYPDPAGDWMNILVRDDVTDVANPTYRVYHAGIDRSGASGNIGSFWVFEGRPIFTPGAPVEGPVELADVDGDGLPDLVHGYTGGGGGDPLWYVRANLGGNLNFDSEQPVRPFPVDHLFASLDGGSSTALLIDDSGFTGGDPRYSALQIQRQGAKVTFTVKLSTLLRDQQYIFGDFAGSGLPSAFSLGNAAESDPTLAENMGGSFATPIPFVLTNLAQPPSNFTPALRVMDWNQDGRAELIARTRSASQLNEAMFALRWNGSGFSEILLPFQSSWDMQFPEQFELFEVFDYDGNGLDDIVMFSGGSLHVFVRDGNKADMLTGIVDGLGAQTAIKYAPISDPAVHTPVYGATYPQRALAGKVWVVAQHQDDDGIGGVNTYQFQYQGALQDVTGFGFVGFSGRDVLHVETGITTHTTYMPGFLGFGGMYPLAGLPTAEVTHIPLGNGIEHVTTTHTTYAVRPTLGQTPYFVFPLLIVEENVESANGVPTMPVRRRTITQDMDGFGNVVTYAEVWSDGNKHSFTSTYSNDPITWLIGLLSTITEQSTTLSGSTQTRNRAYEYDAQGLLSREIIEPGPKGPTGYLPLGPQADGVKTLYRSIDRYPNGNAYRIVDEETADPTGVKYSTTLTYDDLEHMFPTRFDDDLGHHRGVTYHPGLALIASLEDENGVRRARQYDGFRRFRHETSPDGNDFTAHYVVSGGSLRVTLESAAGPQLLSDHDTLGRVVTLTAYTRDDGTAIERDVKYDGLGRVVGVARPRFAADTPVYDTFTYDTLGRPTGWTAPDGSTTTNEYRGEWVISVDANKNATAVRLDNLDRVIFSTDRDAALIGNTPGPAGTTYGYGPFNTLVTVTDIVGNQTTRMNDRLGRLIDLKDPDRGHHVYQYNAFGDLLQETKANSHVVLYQYDAVGRLYWIQDAVDGDVKYTWDTAANGIGKVAQSDAPTSGVTIAYAYDLAGRLVTKMWTIGVDTYAITKTFDAVGRLDGITFPQVGAHTPFTLGYQYGNFGQLLRAVDASTSRLYWRSVSSDASGLFGENELGNGVLDSWIEDPARPGVLKSIQTRDSKRSLLRNLVYGFDANLNVQSREDKVVGSKEKFEYDNFNRLHRWRWKGVAGTRRTRWDYDDIGNVLLRAVEVGPGANLAYNYNPAVAGPHAVVSTTLGTYTYDAEGNQISSPGRSAKYGRQDLPTQVTRTAGKTPGAINFVYDGEMTRVRAIDQTTGISSDTLLGFYEFRRPNGKQGPNGEHIFTLWVKGRPVARRTWVFARKVLKEDTVQYLHDDHQGSIDLVSSAKGKVLERLKYEPFGRRVSVTDPAKLPGARKTDLDTGYTAHDHVEAWELIDMKGRFYDPILGKFLTADPFVPDPLNPQSWNRYSYVLNNPLSRRDPTGFDDGDDDDPNSPRSMLATQPLSSSSPRPRHEATVRARETIYAPGINSLEGCLADAKCTEAHVITLPRRDAPPPPPTAPTKDDDGRGGAAQSGLPPSAGEPSGLRRYSNARDRDPNPGNLNISPRPFEAGLVHEDPLAWFIGLGGVFRATGRLILGRAVRLAAEEVATVAGEEAVRVAARQGVSRAARITLSFARLWHILPHAQGFAPAAAKKSFFFATVNLPALIAAAEEVAPQLQSIAKLETFERVVVAGTDIGVDRITGLPTAVYTVITNIWGEIVTLFPGLPKGW